MGRPTHLKTPFGFFLLNDEDHYIHLFCQGCEEFNIPSLDLGIQSKFDMRPYLSEALWYNRIGNLFCPSCAPDNYIFEPDPIKKKEEDCYRCGGSNGAVTGGSKAIILRQEKPTGSRTDVEPAVPSKPLSFQGHLEGCFAERWQDNDHCSCWRVITESPQCEDRLYIEQSDAIDRLKLHPLKIIRPFKPRFDSDWD